MSIVSDHAAAAGTQAFDMFGAEAVVVGGTTIMCVLAEAESSKDYSEAGFKPTISLSAVCFTSSLPTVSIDKKQATARGETYRVEGISKGATFARFTLEAPQKS
jgi:hypothetical protein